MSEERDYKQLDFFLEEEKEEIDAAKTKLNEDLSKKDNDEKKDSTK